MSDVDEYRKRIEGGATGSTTEDYYKLARDQEYSLLLNKEVALENAKSNALKYTQNQINAQGFGGTGYGSSLQSGIYNNYMNKANEAYADYGNNIRNINYQESEANANQANDRFQSITTMLSQADNVDSMNKLLTDYGYGSVDANGNFNWNAQKPEGMSDDDWYQMQYYYGIQKNALNQTNGNLFNYDSKFVYYDKDGNVQRSTKNKDAWNWEVDTAEAYVASGDFKNGSYVALENNQGQTIYLQIINGQYYYAKPEDFEKNGGYKITGKSQSYTTVKPKGSD